MLLQNQVLESYPSTKTWIDKALTKTKQARLI